MNVSKIVAFAFIFFSLQSSFISYGMEEDESGSRRQWEPPSTSLPRVTDQSVPIGALSQQWATGLSETQLAHLRRIELEQIFNLHREADISALRKFFANPAAQITILQGLSLAQKIMKEMRESGLDPSHYLIREYRYRLLPPANAAQEEEWDAVLPQHTLLYHLIQLSRRYEAEGPAWILPYILCHLLVFLAGAAELVAVVGTFGHVNISRHEIAPAVLIVAGMVHSAVACYFLYPRVRRYMYQIAFDRDLSAINNTVRAIYRQLTEADKRLDQETLGLIDELCKENPRPRVIDEVFSAYCKGQKEL